MTTTDPVTVAVVDHLEHVERRLTAAQVELADGNIDAAREQIDRAADALATVARSDGS
jgi:hypothetical protein